MELQLNERRILLVSKSLYLMQVAELSVAILPSSSAVEQIILMASGNCIRQLRELAATMCRYETMAS